MTYGKSFMQASGRSEKAYFYPREGSTVFLSPDNVLTRTSTAISLRCGTSLSAGDGSELTLPPCSASHSRVRSARGWRRNDEINTGALHAGIQGRGRSSGHQW